MGSVLSNERYSLSHPLSERHVRFSSGDGWLELNVDTGAGGSCVVEILDATTRRPLPGLSLAQAVPIVAHSVEARAQWRGAPSLKSAGAVGRPVRLRFVLQAAKLFGFRFARTGA